MDKESIFLPSPYPQQSQVNKGRHLSIPFTHTIEL